ncbi:MAG: hypothetical protein ACO1PN_04030 [Betaproteobacteria bacterium]
MEADDSQGILANPATIDASRIQSSAYLRDWFVRLAATPPFMDVLAGHLPGDMASQGRLPELVLKLQALAQLK